MIALWIVIGIIVILLLWMWGLYNGLVRARLGVKNAWAQIDVQLKRRFDLIPNLIETVKGYRDFERGTLEAVTKARTAVQQVPQGNTADRLKAEGELGAALSRLMVVVEQYPDLKAGQNFMALQGQLASTENMISEYRQVYNNSVQTYNMKTQGFPSNVVAGMFNFKKEEPFLQATENEAETKAPKVSF